MLRFKVFENGAPAKSLNLDGAYLVGNERVPMRALLEFADGEILCDVRSRGAAALSIMWSVDGVGRIMMETTRLPERRRPYNLHVELARGQLMRISQKREDWGFYDYPDCQSINEQIDAARDLLISAITATDDMTAARLGDVAIAAGLKTAENMGVFHADLFLKRRRTPAQLAKRPLAGLGCRLDPSMDPERCVSALGDAFALVVLPFTWRELEPARGKYQPAAIERWLQVLGQRQLPVWGCPVLSFDQASLPAWVLPLAKKPDQLRECVGDYLKFVFRQFGARIRAWEVVTGIHAPSALPLSYEQRMEFTRLAAIHAKQFSPRSTAILGITLPWGEYYASAADPATIPPLLYADMVIQNGINFDAFGLDVRFGGNDPWHRARDMLEVSALLDLFAKKHKPIHVTAAGVPSGGDSTKTGFWHGDWSEVVQAEWLRDFCQTALSKPPVETVVWQALADPPDGSHCGGVLHADFSPKPSYGELLNLSRRLREQPSDTGAEDAYPDDSTDD